MIDVLGTAYFRSSFAARHLSTENSKSPLKMCQMTVANLRTLCHFQVCEHHNLSAPIDLFVEKGIHHDNDTKFHSESS